METEYVDCAEWTGCLNVIQTNVRNERLWKCRFNDSSVKGMPKIQTRKLLKLKNTGNLNYV
jgi:hypothetical protein